jgi:hypothetical protein
MSDEQYENDASPGADESNEPEVDDTDDSNRQSSTGPQKRNIEVSIL